jgi:ABC-type nitrate/sulfonate/bicarbonate transport system ATPase subunit
MSICILTAGYLIPPPNGKVWIRWIFYVNPLGLGFGMIMANEFMRIDLTCPDSSLIPSGPGYRYLGNQVCNLPGAISGTRSVTGLEYIGTAFHFRQSDLWRNFGILLAIIILLFIVNVVIADVFFGFQQKRPSLTFVKPGSHNSTNGRNQLSTDDSRPVLSSNENDTFCKSLTWENLSYDIKTSRGKRRLLHDLCGYIKPGQLVALMGASGSGKTTLLDVLAQRKNIGVISGNVFIGSKLVDSNFQRSMGYAEQMDVHQPTQSVREALKFSADLRQSSATSEEAKVAHVEHVIRLLELEGIANAIIGTVDNGLNLEQRKMLTIGVELAAKPEVLLFLDEPTSGLDSVCSSSYSDAQTGYQTKFFS